MMTSEDNQITIIEGPPPVFEPIRDGWALGLNEGPQLSITLMTRLRTFNGPALVERCYRAWNSSNAIHLHYRNDMGLEEHAPILAVRSVDTQDGQVLLLWLYFKHDKVQFEFDSGENKNKDDTP